MHLFPDFTNGKNRENILKWWANPALKKIFKVIGRKLIISSSNNMKPPLNALKQIKIALNIHAGFLKNQRNIQKTNWGLVTEVDRPKTSCI